MRAVRHTESGIEVVEVDAPAGSVRVAVRSAGICGSDLHMLSWGPMPHTLGHEVGGTLEDGTPVAILPVTRCGACDRCLAGEEAQCRAQGPTYGIAADGGMAEAIVVPEACIVPVPTGVSAADAALVEPLACAVHALRRSGTGAADRVAVVGAGAIGLAATAVAGWLGAGVDVVARHDAQRAAVAALGAGTEPAGEYDVVVDAAGTGSSLAGALALLRPGGTIAMVATHWEPAELPQFFTTKEPTIVSAMTYSRADMDDAARVLADRPEVPNALVSHRLPLDRAAEAFRIAADRAAGARKVLLEP